MKYFFFLLGDMETIFNLKYNLLHNKIIHNSPPSLRHLATVKAAINLWYEEKVITEWNDAQRNIQDKVPLLEIPKSLQENVAFKAELVGDQLYKFDEIVYKCIHFRSHWHVLQIKIHWTGEGTVDKKRTLEVFTFSTELDLETRFKIAVEFYMEDRINALAVQLPSNFVVKDENKFSSLYEMPGVSAAREHFGILSWTAPNYYDCFVDDETLNELQMIFYWQQLTEQDKLDFILDLYNPCYTDDVYLFLVTQPDTEQKIQVLQRENVICKLLETFLNLRWFPFFASYLNEMSDILELNFVLSLLCTCVYNLKLAFAYKTNYAQTFYRLIELLKSKRLKDNSLLDFYDMSTTVSILLRNEDKKFLEAFLACVTVEDRKVLGSKLNAKDLELWFTSSVKLGKLSSTIQFLFPTVDDRKNFLINERFEKLVPSFSKKKQLSELEEFFALFLSDIDDPIESYMTQFTEDKGPELCQKFFEDGNIDHFEELINKNLNSQDEIATFANNARLCFWFNHKTNLMNVRKHLEDLIAENELTLDCDTLFEKISNCKIFSDAT